MAAKTTVSYVGRTVDLYLFNDLPLTTPGVPMRLKPLPSGRIITGLEKAIQRWVTLFLTPIGSVTSAPLAGSSFIPSVQSGAIQNVADIVTVFAAANAQVMEQLPVTDTMKLDEIIASVELEDGSQVSPPNLYLRIKILTQAGSSRVVTVPVSTVIR